MIAGTGEPKTSTIYGHPQRALTAAAVHLDRLHWLACIALVLLSLALNTWSLSIAGYGNTYYAAAARSMTASWTNFFFGSFDPGGLVTVDKPPGFLWIDALSARMFGYSTWSLLLPSAFAGAASVGLLWAIVRRYFGLLAATIAGLALALSPISVAVDRLNLPEPFLILTLLGAAGAVLQSLESRRWWAWTAFAGVLVGAAFNMKMLAAWIPGPAFAAAIVFASPKLSWVTARNVLLRLAILAGVTLVVSSSWLVVVDAWPASDRPYIGSSSNNTVLDLALGYNGFARIAGDGGGHGPATVSGPGGIFGGEPGPLRMFDGANGGQIGWLLPFALGGGLFAVWFWRREPTRRAGAALFLGWTLLYGATFSYAQGTFHAFYSSAMAPAVAAAVGLGAAALLSALPRDRRWLLLAIGLIGITLATQIEIADRTPNFYGWVRSPAVVTVTAGALAVIVFAERVGRLKWGLLLSVAGLLLLPAAWSVSASANASLNATVPQAGPQQGVSGGTFGSLAYDNGAAELAPWLKLHTNGSERWQLAVPNSQNAARLIAQYGFSVMPLGGFLGRDDTISLTRFADLASSGSIRYVLVNQGARAGRRVGPALPGAALVSVPGPSAVMAAVVAACSPVRAASLPARYRDLLFDCGGRAEAIRLSGR